MKLNFEKKNFPISIHAIETLLNNYRRNLTLTETKESREQLRNAIKEMETAIEILSAEGNQ